MNRPCQVAACVVCLVAIAHVYAQGDSVTGEEEKQLAALERRLENAMVSAEVDFLQRAIGDDFRFSHGTGRVTGKSDTLTIAPGSFLSRELANQEVELHGNVGITSGRLFVRTNAAESARKLYTVVYVRVYERRRGAWQLISHRTVEEVLGSHKPKP